ncbi:transcription elongation factor GreA [Denitrovibrio acetiphilus DSM 12809]|uniref:Transcription elongation factor GreA n=1 Tax=Denitrovibrio acetiphilus (strain DSM 12809 / NBRC 114555 / N2460) TaxID=522772 RepID=D4H0L2_DENA2|nr:transcription elongation factor GreA [Denitrovibrio acetiphilus]ADD68525.1 transcription elongation factor GreA [Denitrovibrio acetiphilus DSM 12809]
MDRIPITTEGYARLKKELEKLKTIDRKEIVAAIAEARSHGDLSENAEYDAAKERQGMIEARIAELESKMGRFQVIDTKSLSGDKIVFGATVTIENIETEEQKNYKIVGPDEANISNGTISIMSPLARALVNKKVGDEVLVVAPGGELEYEVLEVKFN